MDKENLYGILLKQYREAYPEKDYNTCVFNVKQQWGPIKLIKDYQERKLIVDQHVREYKSIVLKKKSKLTDFWVRSTICN